MVYIDTFGLLCQTLDELFDMQTEETEIFICFTDMKKHVVEHDESCLFRIN